MKLLVLDVEGTLFRAEIRLPGASFYSTIWQAIAKELGPEAAAEELQTQEKWKNGHYLSYIDWMKDTISIHIRHGLSKDVFERLISSAKYNPHVLKTLTTVDRRKYEMVLVSGGFRELVLRAQRRLKIIHGLAACEYSFSKYGKLVNYNLIPCDFRGKIVFIRLMLHEYGLDQKDWIFVGDGPNDVQVARVAPISVGYRPHKKLRRVVTYTINDFAELIPILKCQKRP